MEKRLQVILTNKEPSNEHVLWLNTNDNLLYRYSADAWTPINKIKFPTAEIYDPNKEYEEYSLVQFEGSSYIALKYVPINKYPSNSYYWLLFAKKGEQGLQGNSGYQGNIDELEIVNNLTQGGETAALSAEQGKLLNEKKVDKEKGKQLSTEDFTTLLKNKLEGLNNYNDSELRSIISTIENRLNVLIDTSTSEAIDNFREIVAFLENIEDSTTLESVLINIENQIAGVDNKFENLHSEVKELDNSKVDKVTGERLITEEEVEKFNNKAEKEGVYPNFVSGWSSNLTGRGDATERMFVYAPTGGDLSIGDGVAKIKAIKGNSIVEDGSIKSLNVSALKTTGFNQWDEEWELGTIKQATGELLDTTANIRSSNPINVFPNTIYNVYFPKAANVLMDVFFYDIENTFIKRLYVNSTTFTTPENCFFIKFTMTTAYGKVYKNDICINLSHTGYRNGEYEPYEEHALRLDSLSKYMPLRSIPGVYDEINANEAIKRIGVVKLKDLTWSSPNADLLSKSIFNAKISDMRPRGESESETTYRKSILCSKYSIASNTSYDTMNDKSIFRQGSAYGIVIRDTAYTTIADFIASLTDDDVVYYELTEPNEEVFAEAINLNYLVSDFGTEEAIVAEDSAPFRADIIYQFNAQDRIRKNSEVIATIDSKYLAATPSGNPNHNLYTSLGATWSDAGWELNGVPLTNEEIDVSYLCSVPYLHRMQENAWSNMQSYFANRFKTNFCSLLGVAYNSSQRAFNADSIGYAAKQLQVVRFQDFRNETSYKVFINNPLYMFGNNENLREIQDYLDVSLCTSFASAFGARTKSLETIWLIGLKASINFAGTPVLKKECLLYMIQKAAPTSAITITVHADVYAWASTDAEVQAALAAQPLVTLISA